MFLSFVSLYLSTMACMASMPGPAPQVCQTVRVVLSPEAVAPDEVASVVSVAAELAAPPPHPASMPTQSAVAAVAAMIRFAGFIVILLIFY